MSLPGVDFSYLFSDLNAELLDFFAKENAARPNDFSVSSQSVVNTVNVAIAPPIPTAGNLQPTIEYAQAVVAESVAESVLPMAETRAVDLAVKMDKLKVAWKAAKTVVQ